MSKWARWETFKADEPMPEARLHLTLPDNVLGRRGDAGKYLFELCTQVVFSARSNEDAAGLHYLPKLLIYEPGEHELKVYSRKKDRQIHRMSIPLEGPREGGPTYVIRTLECEVAPARSARQASVRVGEALAPDLRDEVFAATDCNCACSVRG